MIRRVFLQDNSHEAAGTPAQPSQASPCSSGSSLGATPPGEPSDGFSIGTGELPMLGVPMGEASRLDEADRAGPDAADLRSIGEYMIVREIGRGGMGVVYEAVQPSLARRVALKVLPYARTLDPRQLLRFKNESMAAAQLDHPGIVRVISVGHERGGHLHYYAMQYVEGQSLAEVLGRLRAAHARHDDSTLYAQISQGSSIEQNADATQVSPHDPSDLTTGPEFFRRVADWGLQAAHALEHAHATGVIHRDIKPSNLLLDREGRILITDFGVALIRNAPELTLTGDVLGTARYMSPEQCRGGTRLVDHRTDIYSLGATLYELLTLRPVCLGDDRQELMRQVVDETPPSPRNVDRTIPADLETIVLKALAKERDDRYASAEEMADDLRRFLHDQPIVARRPTLPQRIYRWSRKHRSLVATGVVLLMLAAFGFALSTSLVLEQRNRAEAAVAMLQEYLYAAHMRLAFRAWHNADVDQVGVLLNAQRPDDGKADLRGFEWRLLWNQAHASRMILRDHRDEVYYVCYSPDGRHLASAGKDAVVRLWDAQTGQLAQTLVKHPGEINGLAFRGDGRQLATACDDGKVRLHDIATGQVTSTLAGQAKGVFCVAYADHDRCLVAGGRGGTVMLWRLSQGQEATTVEAHADNVECLSVSPDGRQLATGSRDDTIKIWSLPDLQRQRTLDAHGDTILAIAFSPDGRKLASGGEDDRVQVWDLASDKPLHELRGHSEWVQSLCFAPGSRVLLSASKDGTVRAWDAEQGALIGMLRGHEGRVWSVATSPQGATLATAGADRTVRIWNWRTVQRYGSMAAAKGHPATMIVSPNGRHFAVADSQGTVSLYDSGTAELQSRTATPTSGCRALAFLQDGRTLFSAGTDRHVRGLAVPTLELAHDWGELELPVEALLAHPTQPELICLLGDQKTESQLFVCYPDQPSRRRIIRQPLGQARCCHFSVDGKALFVGQHDGRMLVLSWPSGSPSRQWPAHDGVISAVGCNPAGTLLATASHDRTIRLWSWPEAELKMTLHGHTASVHSLSFSHDGRTLASGGADGVVRLWSPATGQELTMLAVLEQPINTVEFLPDSRGLMAASNSSGNDALLSWFIDGSLWSHPVLDSIPIAKTAGSSD